ncbi:hypothetical protein [Aminipila terrae]|uniref:Uncharacterized protein n=1 Tax=Aminipila terrae TaxID=2697030 RepID=A0A6P1MFA9_9FIRM|nr:hypothetical protein [Aminipila terrae]QHI71843.1 hypothetical protein Ami3637_05085 [Aminipila terrae]
MLEEIENRRIMRFIACFILCYILMCNIFVNSFYHLKADEKVEKVIVRTPAQEKIVITSDKIIEKVNRQFHMQVFFSLGLGELIENKIENKKDVYKIIFYNDKDKEVKWFNYNPENKRIYPGELKLPVNTQLVMDEMVYPESGSK